MEKIGLAALKLIIFCQSHQIKRGASTLGEDVCNTHNWQRLISRIYKHILSKVKIYLIKAGQKTWIDISQKRQQHEWPIACEKM